MSFEGFYIKKCKNEHIWEHDVYDSLDNCPICDSPSIIEKIFDQTNGYDNREYDRVLKRIEKFKPKTKAD